MSYRSVCIGLSILAIPCAVPASLSLPDEVMELLDSLRGDHLTLGTYQYRFEKEVISYSAPENTSDGQSPQEPEWISPRSGRVVANADHHFTEMTATWQGEGRDPSQWNTRVVWNPDYVLTADFAPYEPGAPPTLAASAMLMPRSEVSRTNGFGLIARFRSTGVCIPAFMADVSRPLDQHVLDFLEKTGGEVVLTAAEAPNSVILQLIDSRRSLHPVAEEYSIRTYPSHAIASQTIYDARGVVRKICTNDFVVIQGRLFPVQSNQTTVSQDRSGNYYTSQTSTITASDIAIQGEMPLEALGVEVAGVRERQPVWLFGPPNEYLGQLYVRNKAIYRSDSETESALFTH